MIAFSEETCGVERSQPLVISPPLSHPSRVSLGQWMTNLVRIIREGAESGVWGDEIAPKMIVAA
jgi:hypothetical protein